MRAKLVNWWDRLRHDPYLWDWLLPGVLGGLSGGAAVAWLLWGAPSLLTAQICFVFTVPLVALAYLVVCALGITLIFLIRRSIKAIRRMRTPASVAMWEPVEPMVELDSVAWPHPGCGIAFYLPLILLSAAGALPWFIIGVLQVALWRMLATMLVGLPVGLIMSRREAKVWRQNDESLGM